MKSLTRVSSILALSFLAAAPIAANAQEGGRGGDRVASCVGAAHAMRDWGWGEFDRAQSTSIAPEFDRRQSNPMGSIVSVVNNQLRMNAGILPENDIKRLRVAASSVDPCIRELAIGILETQAAGKVARGRSVRLAKSVTPLSEKQSSTGENITQ